jgi:hypothetical protein
MGKAATHRVYLTEIIRYLFLFFVFISSFVLLGVLLLLFDFRDSKIILVLKNISCFTLVNVNILDNLAADVNKHLVAGFNDDMVLSRDCSMIT